MKLLRDITHLSERVDKKKSMVNCSGCAYKIGNVCSFFKARLQSNPHRPTDCKEWKEKVTKGSL